MRLEDFTAMVDIPGDADTMHVEQCSTRVESGSRYSAESNEMIDNILINCVSELNLLAGNTVYFVTGGYRSSVGRSGVTFEKTDVDVKTPQRCKHPEQQERPYCFHACESTSVYERQGQ